MSLCKHCISGVTHEGTPTGKIEEIAGIRCYVATPSVDYRRDKVLLYLDDAAGIDFINAQLLADDFARNGFKTIAPDYLDGDPVPKDVMEGKVQNFDILAWANAHTQARTRPILDKVISALKESGVKSFGATGYCFGGISETICVDLAFDHIISVGVASHPSLLKIPEDLEKYASTAKAPLLINSCTIDSQFPIEAQEKADQILGGGKFAPGYKREYFEGCTHGFAVRGDLSDPKVKAGKEGAFTSAVEWLIKYL